MTPQNPWELCKIGSKKLKKTIGPNNENKHAKQRQDKDNAKDSAK